jgi:hypothetical protein
MACSCRPTSFAGSSARPRPLSATNRAAPSYAVCVSSTSAGGRRPSGCFSASSMMCVGSPPRRRVQVLRVRAGRPVRPVPEPAQGHGHAPRASRGHHRAKSTVCGVPYMTVEIRMI